MAGVWASSHLTFDTGDIDAIFNLRQGGDIDVGFPPKAYMHFLGDHSDFVRRINLTPAPSGTTAILQAYFYTGSSPATENIIAGFLLGSNYQCSVKIKSDRTLQAYRGGVAGTAIGSASATAIPQGTDVKIGIKCVIDTGTGGSVYVVMKVAGVETVLLNLTGVNTQNEATGGWDGFDYEAASAGHTYWTDVVVMDGSGPENNDLLSLDAEVWPSRPNGAGDEQEWTPDTGAHSERVDDTVQDGDSSYLSSGTVGNTELLAFDDVSLDDAIAFVVLHGFAKLQSGSGTVAPRGSHDGTSTTGTARTPGGSYSYSVDQPYQRAVSGQAWSPTRYNAHQWGIERTGSAGEVRVTQLAVDVVLLIGTDPGPEGETPDIPLDDSVGCCGSDGVEGSGVSSPGAGVETKPAVPGWTARCAGGGAVPTAAPLNDGERWG